MTDLVRIIVSGPVGSGKSALAQELVIALRALKVEAEMVGIDRYDTGGDHIESLEIYREGIRVEVSESLFTERMIDARVGGHYDMPDGRSFWIDGAVAREIARRVLATEPINLV